MSVRRSSAAVLGLLSSVRGLEVGGVDPVGDSSPGHLLLSLSPLSLVGGLGSGGIGGVLFHVSSSSSVSPSLLVPPSGGVQALRALAVSSSSVATMPRLASVTVSRFTVFSFSLSPSSSISLASA